MLVHETIEKLSENILKKVPVSFENLDSLDAIQAAVDASVDAPFALGRVSTKVFADFGNFSTTFRPFSRVFS